MELAIATPKGNNGTVEVSEAAFGNEFNQDLVHQTVVAFLAGARQGTRAQKNRSAVSGGGGGGRTGAVVVVDVAPISPSASIPVVSAARPVPVVTAVPAGVPPPPPLNTISPELRGFRWRNIGLNSILYLLVKNVVERLKAIPASTF